MNQKITDLVSLNKTPCLQGSASADKAILAMNSANVDIVGVACDHDFVGVFSRKDFEKHVTRRNLNPRNTTLYEVMTINPPTVQCDYTFKETYEAMLSYQWNYMPILNGSVLCGIVTISDLGHDIIKSFEEAQEANNIIMHYIQSGESYGTADYKH